MTTPESAVSRSERGGEKRAGVVGLGPREQLRGRPLLDDLAVLHDDHVVGQRPHDLEIVADEQVGEVAPLLQVAQQVDDLRLHGHVERRGRLVEHDEFAAPAPWRARSRCAGAGRRRIRAGSGPSRAGSSPTSLQRARDDLAARLG